MHNELIYSDEFNEQFLRVFYNAKNTVTFDLRQSDGQYIAHTSIDLLNCAFLHKYLGEVLETYFPEPKG